MHESTSANVVEPAAPWAPFERGLLPVAVVAGLLVALTLLLEVPAIGRLVPHGPWGWARRNSEAWSGAALLMVDLWWVPRDLVSRGWRAWWAVVLGLAVLTALVGPEIGLSDRLVTLQEPFIAVAVLSPLLRWGHDGFRRGATMSIAGLLASLAVLVAAVPALRLSPLGQLVVDQAESVALIALAVVLLAGVHHWPSNVGRLGIRITYLSTLIAAPIGFAMAHRVEPGGVRFAQRTTESFLAVLIVALVVELLVLRATVVRGRVDGSTSRPPTEG